MTRLARHYPLLVLLAVLGLWAWLLDGGVVQHRALAGPVAIGGSLISSLHDGSLVRDVLATALRSVAAVAIGWPIGVALGLWVGLRRRGTTLEPILDLLRAVPPLLVLPVLLLALGYGDAARIGAAAWATALVASLHVAAGARRRRPERDRVMRALGATRWQRLKWLHAPELAPHALTALRQSASAAILVTVVVEMMVGAASGLGARAVAAQIAYDAPGLWGAIAVTGALGFAAGHLVLAAEQRIASWR